MSPELIGFCNGGEMKGGSKVSSLDYAVCPLKIEFSKTAGEIWRTGLV